MTKVHTLVSRSSAAVAAAVLVAATAVPALLGGSASAAVVDDRYIKMNTSEPGATYADPPTDSLLTQWEIGFEVQQTTAIEAIVIDICDGSDSPLVGLACATPEGFSWGTPTVVDADIGATDIQAWTFAATGGTLQIDYDTDSPVTPSVNDEVVITMEGITNPVDVDDDTEPSQENGTFFARIITFSTEAAADGYDPTDGPSTAGYIDTGGVALSTNDTITVTARVEEQIKFCLYNNATPSTCDAIGAGTATGIDLPNADDPLQNSALETNDTNAYFGLESNALNGVDVRMYGGNGDEGTLKSGTNIIEPFALDGTADNGVGDMGDDANCTTVNVAAEQFGLRLVAGAGVTASTPYNGAAGCYGWDGETGGADADSVGSEYGDIIATTAGAQAESQTQMIFAAKAIATTEAGLYTTDLNFIATGKY